jgi:hypothetical protein
MNKRNQSTTASYPPWEMARNVAEKKLMAWPGAQTAFNRLTRRGIGREHLLDGLIFMQIARRTDNHPSTVRRNRAIIRGAPEGMTWGQFSRFLQQLQKMATTVDTVNRSPYYNPSAWFYRPPATKQGGGRDLVAEFKTARANAGRLDADYFLQLPARLREYAIFLQLIAEKVSEQLRTTRQKAATSWLKHRDELAAYVHTHCKGQKCMDDIAVLISAALGNEEEVDPETLRKQVYRKKRSPHSIKRLF